MKMRLKKVQKALIRFLKVPSELCKKTRMQVIINNLKNCFLNEH